MKMKKGGQKKNTLRVIYIVVVVLILTACGGEEEAQRTDSAVASPGGRRFKILHIMSYHSPWEWTDNQLKGFQSGLGDIDVEYKIFQMDAKRKSSKEWLDDVSRRARELIETWQPDLVYTTDDIVQKQVV